MAPGGPSHALPTDRDELFPCREGSCALSGEATIWTPAFEEKARFTHEHSAKWGVIGLEVFGSRIVSHTYEDLQVHDDRGRKLGAWTCPGRLEDAWLDGDEVYIAAGPHVHRVALGDLAS